MKDGKICSRTDFNSNKCTFNQYYQQFVTEETKRILLSNIPLDRLLKSKDKHLNDIPLKRWDDLPETDDMVHRLRERGDYITLAGKVCIYKQTAREILKKQKK
jgi:hypothetical protein